MSWSCRRCGGRRAFIDCEEPEPRLVGCLDCNWNEVLGADRYRCIASIRTHGLGARCQRATVGSSFWRSPYCHQHVNYHLRDVGDEGLMVMALSVYLRNLGDGIPLVYRYTFEHALRDAGIIIRDEQHETELAERVRQVRAKPELGPSLVYFIEREGLIKIGFSTNLSKRLKAISKGSSMPDGMTIGPVVLLATEPGDRRREERLHRRFDRSRVGNSEWFRPSKALRRYIEDLVRFQQRANAA